MDIISCFPSQHYEATAHTTGKQKCAGTLWNNQGKTTLIKHAEPTELMIGDTATTDLKPSKLSEYADYCQSLRNFVEPQKISHVSLSPMSVINEAEKRLLSSKELDVMHQHMSQQKKIDIGGTNFTLETLPADTPLIYQFYCRDKKKSIDKKSILIFEHNCTIEKSRPIIILTHSSLTNPTLTKQIKNLVEKHENVCSVDMKELLPELSVRGIKIVEAKDEDGEFILRFDLTGSDEPIRPLFRRNYKDMTDLCNIMDAFQFLVMYNCVDFYKLAKVKTRSLGCLKIDWDTMLLEALGIVECPGGFRTYIIDTLGIDSDRPRDPYRNKFNDLTHFLKPENGLVAVTKPHHPIFANSFKSGLSVYSHFRIAVANFFQKGYNICDDICHSLYDEATLEPDNRKLLEILCSYEIRNSIGEEFDPDQPLRIKFFSTTSWLQKIAFPLGKVKADQSRVRGVSSWAKNESASSPLTSVRETGIFKGRACNIL